MIEDDEEPEVIQRLMEALEMIAVTPNIKDCCQCVVIVSGPSGDCVAASGVEGAELVKMLRRVVNSRMEKLKCH